MREPLTEKQLTRSCPVCENSTGQLLHTARFALIENIPLADHYDVVACTQCSFLFADTASSQANYDRYYARHSKYEDAITGTGHGMSPRDSARIRVTAEHIASLVPDRATRIADIGCANGGLLAALQTLGYTDLTGIDPSPACARIVDSREGITGIAGSFSHLPAPEKPYDLVLLTGVFEHVQDLEGAIRATESILAPQGKFYIAVPDAGRYTQFLFAPFQEFNLEHINHFTVRSLANLMEHRGYRTLATEQLYCDGAVDSEPALFGLFQRGASTAAIKPDCASVDKMRTYIEASQAMMDQLQVQLQALFNTHPKLILWGTGQLALKLLRLPVVNPAQISALVDSNPINQGRSLLGKPILSPAEITHMQEPILPLTTLSHGPIEHCIREELKMTNPVLQLTLV